MPLEIQGNVVIRFFCSYPSQDKDSHMYMIYVVVNDLDLEFASNGFISQRMYQAVYFIL